MPVTNKKPIAITLGEPAGIGPDIVLQLFKKRHFTDFSRLFVIVGNTALLQQRAEQLQIEVRLPPCVDIPLPVPCIPGKPTPDNSAFVMATLEYATDRCLAGEFGAMVTGPVNKALIEQSGIAFSGHTEYLAHRTHSPHVVMIFIEESTRLALLTTHIPLHRVPEQITVEKIKNTISIIQGGLIHYFNIAHPTIMVTGLNPHAGEGGHLGDEEIRIIQPALHSLALQYPDLRLIGPVSADTVFYEAKKHHADCILSMYHDQSLPVMKAIATHRLVNLTLGLPFIRTSVDHGTAFDVAGSGHANENSLLAALHLAIKLS